MPIVNNISIIIPAYNEREELKKSLPIVYEVLKSKFNNFEIIIVDDGSSDNTSGCILELTRALPNIKLIQNNRNYGKGHSVKRGVFSAQHQYILFSDADFSTSIDELDKFMGFLNNGDDIIIGSRGLSESEILKRQCLPRKTAGKIFNLIVQVFLFKGIKDTQCGFKCFKQSVAKDIFKLQRINRFCFDAEILYIARKKGYSVKEVPVKWVNRKESKVSFFKDSLRMFADIFRIRLNDLKGYYNN